MDGTRTDFDHDDRPLPEAVVTFNRVHESPTRCVLEVTGDLDIAISAVLSRELDELLDPDVDGVVIDLSGVQFMDSSALSALVHAHQRAKLDGRRLELRRPSPACAKVLGITGLDRVFAVE